MLKSNKSNHFVASPKTWLRFWISLFFLMAGFGCKKFVTIDPPSSSVTTSTAYSNGSSAAAVMTGIYSNMVNSSSALSSGPTSISILEGLASDELTNYYSTSAVYSQFYQNALSSNTVGASNNYFWKEIYQEIHVANTVIEGLASSSGVPFTMKQQLDGEAKFIRAFYLFYGVNIYGDVPLVTTSNYLVNNSITRTPKAQVYQQIIRDLKDAQNELTVNFVDAFGSATTERIRPNRGAAQTLLARAYLYTGDWANAKAEADSVINNTTSSSTPGSPGSGTPVGGPLYRLVGLDSVFKKNNKESIWQIPSVNAGYNTWDALYFVLTAVPGTSSLPFALSNTVVNAFEPNDSRFSNWIGVYKKNTTSYYYPYKYKDYLVGDPLTEYLVVFRLAELYLIRAEAKTNLGDINGAQSDLNAIRSRANLLATTANNQASLLSAILHERQVEFFTEWGHRWFDLIRTGNINSVMGNPGNICQTKGGTWNSNWILAPLPFNELQINKNLTQNPGYN